MGKSELYEKAAGEVGDRQAPRYPVEWSVSILVRNGTRIGQARNVSLGGMFVEIDPPMELGQVYSMAIDIPDYRLVHVDGKVVWSISNSKDSGVCSDGMGIMFTGLSEEVRTYLEGRAQGISGKYF